LLTVSRTFQSASHNDRKLTSCRQNKKDKPKPATAAKAVPAPAAKGRARGGRAEARGGRERGGGRAGRERTKKKTVEELDAEMADYFPATADGNTDAMVSTGAEGAPVPAAADTAMDDEML
jgi:THO complex subunit 4